MKKVVKVYTICLLTIFLLANTSCNRGPNCPAYGGIENKTGKDGTFKKKRSSSYDLFPKHMRGKKKRNK